MGSYLKKFKRRPYEKINDHRDRSGAYTLQKEILMDPLIIIGLSLLFVGAVMTICTLIGGN